MLKRVGIPMLALGAMLLVLPAKQAKAGVHFGIGIAAPTCVAPAPVYRQPYVAPAPDYDYYAAPTYVYPYTNYGWDGHAYHRDHDDDHGRGAWGHGGERGGFGHDGNFAHGGNHGGRR